MAWLIREMRHKHLTVVADHATGNPVWIGEGRSQATVGAFFTELGDVGTKQLQAGSMDMCAPYILEARERAPQAEIAFDPFHVVKLSNEAITVSVAARLASGRARPRRPC